MGKYDLLIIVRIVGLLIGILIIWRVARAILLPISDLIFGTGRKSFESIKKEKEKEEDKRKASFRRRLFTNTSNRLDHWSLSAPFWRDRLQLLAVSIFIPLLLGAGAGLIGYLVNGLDINRGISVFWFWFKIISIPFLLFYLWLWAIVIIPSLIMWDIPFLILGNSMLFRGKNEKALKYFEKAVSIFPSEYGFWKIGETLFKIKEVNFDNNSGVIDNSKIIRALSKSIEIGNAPSQVYKLRAEMLTEIGEFDAAFSDYNKIKELFPKSFFDYMFARVYISRAIQKEIVGDWDGAIEDLEEALNHSKLNRHIYYKRAKLMYWKQDYIGAIEDYTQVLIKEKGDPAFNENFWNYGAGYYLKILHEATNNYDGYVDLLKSIIKRLETEKKPIDHHRRGLAEAMIIRGDAKNALRVYERVSTIDNDLLARYKTWENRFEEGLKGFNSEGSDFSFLDYVKKSNYYKGFGKVEEAMDILQEGKEHIVSEEQKIEYLLALGRLKLKIWDYRGAIDALFEAKESDQKCLYPGIYHELAILRRNQAEFTEAEHLYLKYFEVIKRQNKKIEGWMWLDFLQIQIALGKYEDGLDTLENWGNEHRAFYEDELKKMMDIKEKANAQKFLSL